MKDNFKKLFISISFLMLHFCSLEAQEKVSIQLQWLDQFQFAGYYMAKEKGFYKKVGLDVEIKKFKNNISVVDEVLNKTTTYGTGRSSLIIDASNGSKVSILASIFQSSPLVLMSTKESLITNIKQFKNKTIMLSSDKKSVASLNAMTKNSGINIQKDMIVKKHTFNIDDLITGKTDIMLSYISNEPFLLEQKGYEANIFHPIDYDLDFYGDILFTSENEIVNHPKRATKFKKATIQGWEYAFSNINETVDLIIAKHNIQNKSRDALLYEARALKKLAYYKTDKIGKVSQDKLESIYTIYKNMGFIKNEIDYTKFIFYTDNNTIMLNAKEKEWLLLNKPIPYVFDIGWQPFEFIDKHGNHQGIIADYLTLISQISGISFKAIRSSSWNDAVKKVENSQALMYSGVGPTPQRKKHLDFTRQSLIKSNYVFISRKNEDFINGFDDTKDKIIAVPENSTIHGLLKEQRLSQKLVLIGDNADGYAKLINKEVDIFIMNAISAQYYLNQPKYDSLKTAYKTKFMLDLKIAISKDLPKEVLSILNKSIDTIEKKDMDSIINKWVVLKQKQRIDWWLIAKITLGILIVLAFLLYTNYKLSKQVKEQTKDLSDKNKSLIELANSLEIKVQQRTTELNNLTVNLKQRVQDGIKINEKQTLQLVQQSRLAQMGEMINMIAHQWRQPLNAISLTSSNLQIKCVLDDMDKKCFQDELILIDNYSQHLSTTIDDFRNFFKEDKEKEEIKLNDIVKQTLNIIKISTEMHGIKLRTRLHSAMTLDTYASELKQVILNIVKNAEDALVENSISEPCISISTLANTICISDNAGGIKPENLEKIFDPYFSTKLKKDGTGLGLYMSKIIVQEHCNATLQVENKESGAEFKITFNTGDEDEKK